MVRKNTEEMISSQRRNTTLLKYEEPPFRGVLRTRLSGDAVSSGAKSFGAFDWLLWPLGTQPQPLERLYDDVTYLQASGDYRRVSDLLAAELSVFHLTRGLAHVH